MRLAIISDIHGNMDALDEVLADIDKSNVDATICLGDMVGYGPEPEAVVQAIQSRDIATLMGNHELSILDPKYLAWFNPLAKASLIKTITMLSRESMRFIRRLPEVLFLHDCRFVHGFPPASPLLYQFAVQTNQITSVFREAAETLDHVMMFLCPVERHFKRLAVLFRYILYQLSVGFDGQVLAFEVFGMLKRQVKKAAFHRVQVLVVAGTDTLNAELL